MLSQYEEEPDSPSKLADALQKTAVALTQGTEAMLAGGRSSALHLKRVLMCGVAGRNKPRKLRPN